MPRTITVTDKLVEDIKRTSLSEVEVPESHYDPKRLIPTGSTLLNLACSDSHRGGLGTGKLVNLIGDSSSGKTLIALSILAEMAHRSRFDEYELIYDDVEAACEFNLEYLFGEKTAARIRAPARDKDTDEDIHSNTIEDFQDHIYRALESGKPFVYILDSLDALDALDDQKKAQAQIEARRDGGKETAGSYGMAKPKKMSELLRQIIRRVKKTESLVVVVSQTRDDINPASFTKKTRSGGRALKFYSSHEIWTAVAEKIKKKDRIIGIVCKAKITKNKITGKIREVDFPIYYDYGIDDIGSCVDFLIHEGCWKMSGSFVNAPEFKVKLTRAALIKHIEDHDLEKPLKKLVGRTWNHIEEGLKLHRKRKY